MMLSQSEKQWFTKILGLDGQQVEDVRLDEDQKELHLHLVMPPGPYECPLCGRRHTSLHDRRRRAVRDKPWADHTVFVHVPVLRIRCCQGKTPIELPLAEGVKKNTATRSDSAR
jgi:transposase